MKRETLVAELAEVIAKDLHASALRQWPSPTDPFRLGYDSAVLDFRRRLVESLYAGLPAAREAGCADAVPTSPDGETKELT